MKDNKADLAFSKIESCIVTQFAPHAPFLYHYLLKTRFQADDKIGTIGVGVSKTGIEMAFDPDFILNLPPQQLAGALTHELYHIILNTHSRLNGKNQGVWNEATDYTINNLIRPNESRNENWKLGTQRVDLPESDVFKPLLLYRLREDTGYRGSEQSDEIYNFIIRDRLSNPQGGGGVGSGRGKSFDNHSKLDETDFNDKEVQEKLSEVYKGARTREYGNTSKGLIDHLTKLEKPVVNWKRELRMALVNKSKKANGIRYKTWRRLNRRNLPLQGSDSYGMDTLVVVDTSGSTFNILPEFFGEIDRIAQNYGNVKILQFDTKVYDMQEYKRGSWKNFKLQGFGGTNVQPVFDYLKDNNIKVSPVILTDGYFYENVDLKGYKPIWAVYDNSSFKSQGKVIHIQSIEGID